MVEVGQSEPAPGLRRTRAADLADPTRGMGYRSSQRTVADSETDVRSMLDRPAARTIKYQTGGSEDPHAPPAIERERFASRCHQK